jgi:metal-responsive CopG/Arc/MetJ family transcriptional regulator
MGSMVKKRIAVTISEELMKWIDAKAKDTTFANRSHTVEHTLTQVKEGQKKE